MILDQPSSNGNAPHEGGGGGRLLQHIPGCLLDYGTGVVSDTGEQKNHFRTIAAPVEFLKSRGAWVIERARGAGVRATREPLHKSRDACIVRRS